MHQPPKETLDYMRASLRYDPESGKLYWTIAHGRWGRIPAGSEASTLSATTGYFVVRLLGRNYQVHQIAWFLMTGEWPTRSMDHADMDRANNRWPNLRLATKAENMRNRGPQKNKKVPLKGVTIHRQTGKYRASMSINRKGEPRRFISLGLYATKEEAHAAYCGAAKLLHGVFFRGE